MAGLPDRGIRGPLEDAQDGSSACRSTQSAGGGPDAAGGRARAGVGAGDGAQVPRAGGAGAAIGGGAAAAAGLGRGRRRVQALLAESVQWTGGKQRLTATRLHELLLAEGHRVGRDRRQRGGGGVEAAAPRGLRAADVSAGRSRRGRLLRGARRRRRHPPQGVALPDAADVPRAATSRGSTSGRIKSVFSTGTSAPLRISTACRRASPTTICGRRSSGSSSAARAR